MKERTVKEKDRMYYIHSAIGLVIMFGFGFLPPFGPVTPYGMKMLGILIGLIYLWSLVEMGWPCLMGMVAYLLTGATTLKILLAAGFGNATVMISVFATAFAFAIAGQGTFDYMAQWLLTRKMFYGRPWILSLFILLISFVLDLMYAGMAVVFMLWALLPKIADACGMKHNHPWLGSMVVGIVFAMVMGECALPFKPMAMVTISMAQGVLPFVELPYVSYIIFMFSLIIIMTILYLLFLRFVVRIDLSPMKTLDVSSLMESKEPMKGHQKFMAVLLLLFIVAMIVAGSSSLLPDSVVKTALMALSTTGVSFIFFAFVSIYRIEGKPILNLKTTAAQIPWEIVLLIAVVNTVCPAIAAPETGISGLLAQITAPLLSGHSPLIFMFIMFTMTIVLTNFFNNTVVMVIMFNIVASYTAVMTLNYALIVVLVIIFSQIAFLLPASSIWGALCHSQAEMCGVKNIYIPALSLMACAIISLLVAIPLGIMLF